MAFASANFDAGQGASIGARPGAATRPFADRLRLWSLWLVGASSGFVVVEPAPYEFLIMLAMMVFVATGLTLRVGHLPLMFLLILYNIGFATSLIPVVTLDDTAKWTAVSCFLSATTLFFAVALAEDTVRRTDALLRGYGLAALGTAAVAVLAYFRLVPGWEIFIHNLRATATFKDPNVFGPFLILPALIVMQRIMFGGLSRIVPDRRRADLRRRAFPEFFARRVGPLCRIVARPALPQLCHDTLGRRAHADRHRRRARRPAYHDLHHRLAVARSGRRSVQGTRQLGSGL